MGIDGPGREQARTMAALLKDAGTEGKGFRRELSRQLSAAAEPIARKIARVEHLKPYMPDRYAEILAADIAVSTRNVFSANPRISISARTRGGRRRKVRWLDDGFINHPVFARGERKTWDWVNGQTGGMRPGFFTDPCEEAAPDVRERVLQALAETERKILGH